MKKLDPNWPTRAGQKCTIGGSSNLVQGHLGKAAKVYTVAYFQEHPTDYDEGKKYNTVAEIPDWAFYPEMFAVMTNGATPFIHDCEILKP